MPFMSAIRSSIECDIGHHFVCMTPVTVDYFRDVLQRCAQGEVQNGRIAGLEPSYFITYRGFELST